jgi:hypothetical protein
MLNLTKKEMFIEHSPQGWDGCLKLVLLIQILVNLLNGKE